MSDQIELGGRRFDLRPLKLGQLRHVLDALDDMIGRSGGALIEAAARVVAAGLAPSHPDLTADGILDLEATLDELNRAVAAILSAAGLNPSGETRPVASATSVSASGSAPSTAPSPPAAATTTA